MSINSPGKPRLIWVRVGRYQVINVAKRGRRAGDTLRRKKLVADRLAWVTPACPAAVLTPGSPPAHPTPALVAHAQGGLTLGPERGELAADFWFLGYLTRSI